MKRWLPTAMVLLAAAGGLHAQDPSNLEDSVVRIINYAQRANYFAPWDVSNVYESSGTGFVIPGGLVMTNAHVVSDSRMLLLFLHNDPNPHHAEVYQVAHDCDLALVRPLEPGLLDRVPALSFGGLPGIGTTVETLGYPVGGTQVSSTRGVVSRIEAQVYIHSGNDRHLTGQTDAAINPGNSGGPVVQDGKVVGVAFQAIPNLQSVGYFIPMEVITRFLRDVEDGAYDGYVELGDRTSGMENPAARRRAGMAEGETGVRLDRIFPESSADGHLEEGDIILEVAGRKVANDGTVPDGDLRVPFGMLVDRLLEGETVKIRVLRGSERIDLTIPVTQYHHVERQSNSYDRIPRYYVYGGLVFVPLDMEMVKTYGEDWPSRANKALLYEFLFRSLEDMDQFTKERVVLLRRLNHPVNIDMAWHRNLVIERVNGMPIDRLEDLIEAIETHEGDYHLFEFSNYRRFEVLNRKEAEAANPGILQRYGVAKDRNL